MHYSLSVSSKATVEATVKSTIDCSEGTTPFRYQFTIFTATHNRAHTLHRVYESLVSQTESDFEWLVVDDGSTDETRLRIAAWQAIAPFPIRYLYQEPQGKHVAYNRAAQVAQGEWMICMDSDDACVPQALERMKARWEEVPVELRSQYSGLDCHCMDMDGNQLGTDYPLDGLTSNYPEMRYHHRVTGEKWGFQRTVILRKYPFPSFPDFKMAHVPESVVWSPMTVTYPVIYVNECLRIYYQDSAPKTADSEHLTRQKLAIVNPVGLLLLSQTILNVEIPYFRTAPFTFIKAAINWNRSRFHVRDRSTSATRDQLRSPSQSPSQSLVQSRISTRLGKVLCGLMLPAGYVLYRRDLSLQGPIKIN